MSVEDSESRRFELTFGRVFLRPILPKICPGISLGAGGVEKFETFFSKICAHSERYRNILAGTFEIRTSFGNIAFPLSPVSVLLLTRKSGGATAGQPIMPF